MRLAVPTPAESSQATRSFSACTSRNCSASAPGTTRDRQVSPPSVVTVYVPPAALAHTTRSLTGLTAKKRSVVTLVCGVTIGPVLGEDLNVAGVGSKLPEQAMATRATVPAPAAAIERERSIQFSCRSGVEL